jgi:hypothetical protein
VVVKCSILSKEFNDKLQHIIHIERSDFEKGVEERRLTLQVLFFMYDALIFLNMQALYYTLNPAPNNNRIP